MERETWIIAGLGNPGLTYAHTRHNMGFDVTDCLARQLGVEIRKNLCRGLVGEVTRGDRRLVICQPQTLMNRSGLCLGELRQWYKCPPERILVVCDDIDLQPGQLRLRSKGSPGTHNGLRSIAEVLPEGNYPRLRVGVGSPGPTGDLISWVLGRPFTPEEQQLTRMAVERAAEGALAWFDRGMDYAMNHYNVKLTLPS